MSSVPSVEAIILEILQSFGLNKLQTVQKQRYARRQKAISEYQDLTLQILCEVFDSLDYRHEEKLLDDLLTSAGEILQFHSFVENNVRIYGADARQVAWYLLSYQFAPGLGRKYAFWSLTAPVAPGMPYGDLWFLPRPSPTAQTRICLPVQVTAEWWLDLLSLPLEKIWADEPDADNLIRNLQNWHKGKLPSPTTIEAAFRLDRTFTYHGTFRDDPAASLALRFERARHFVLDQKHLGAVDLARELPSLPPDIIEAALSGAAAETQQAAFTAAVGVRWQEPSVATVRRRFLLARVVQDCHVRLAKLISPDVEPTNADPKTNKILQLWALFEKTYWLTIAADKGCTSEAESNARFLELVPQWLSDDLLRLVMPTATQSPNAQAKWYSARFRELGASSVLSDLFSDGQIALGRNERPIDDRAVAERLELEGLIMKLCLALENGDQSDAEILIQQAEEHPRQSEFSADILFLKGRHRLNVNDFEMTKALFDDAFEKCSAGGFGRTRKDTAYACLGMAVASERYSDRAEKCCRVLSTSLDPIESQKFAGPEHEGVIGFEVLFRNLAVSAFEKFWKTLYRPYRGVEPMVMQGDKDFQSLADDCFTLLLQGDKDALQRWAAANKKFLDSRIKDVRGDTLFSLFLKMVNHGEKNSPALSPQVARLRNGLHLLVQLLGIKALNSADFKGQTPLMLAADQGRAELVTLLLGQGVDLDSQDVYGRTALHAAAASSAIDCYLAILQKGADPTRQTKDGLSALYSAVKFGLPEAVEATLEKWPQRFQQNEIALHLHMARDFYADYETLRELMAQAGRQLGPKVAYKMIATTLERYCSEL